MSKNVAAASPPAIVARDLHKTYRLGKTRLKVLRGVSVNVAAGEFVAIVGASGSGKSTLLHLVGLLDAPDRGGLELHGQDVLALSRRRRDRMRCRQIGFVFQFYHLLPELTVLENVLVPAMVDASALHWPAIRGQRRKAARDILEEMGLGERLKHRPKELSGGERQRVAIARALVNSPEILLADEPTGNLDSATGLAIMKILQRWNRDRGQTLLMVTHDVSLAEQADRILHLRDGRLAEGDG
jgi:ABC-type lipoprotein export system ATPase subunit